MDTCSNLFSSDSPRQYWHLVVATGRQAGGMHPTGMLSCFLLVQRHAKCWSNSINIVQLAKHGCAKRISLVNNDSRVVTTSHSWLLKHYQTDTRSFIPDNFCTQFHTAWVKLGCKKCISTTKKFKIAHPRLHLWTNSSSNKWMVGTLWPFMNVSKNSTEFSKIKFERNSETWPRTEPRLLVELSATLATVRTTLSFQKLPKTLMTRMHSSRMRTACSSSHHGGDLHTPLGADLPSPGAGTPLGADPPEQAPPRVWAWRPPSLRVWAWRPPWPDPSTSPLGVGLEACKACWDTTPETCCKACWYTTCNACSDPTPPRRWTDTHV